MPTRTKSKSRNSRSRSRSRSRTTGKNNTRRTRTTRTRTRTRNHTRRSPLKGGYSYKRVKSRKTWSPKRTRARVQTGKSRAKSIASQMQKMINGDKRLANEIFKLADANDDNILTRQELTRLLIAT